MDDVARIVVLPLPGYFAKVFDRIELALDSWSKVLIFDLYWLQSLDLVGVLLKCEWPLGLVAFAAWG